MKYKIIQNIVSLLFACLFLVTSANFHVLDHDDSAAIENCLVCDMLIMAQAEDMVVPMVQDFPALPALPQETRGIILNGTTIHYTASYCYSIFSRPPPTQA